MTSTTLEPNWKGLLDSWDKQQDTCIPNRQAIFRTILDVLGAYKSANFTALDLGAGPGSLSLQILRRYPKASVVAADYDPVLLKIGRCALKRYGKRIEWVDVDIGTAGWRIRLPGRKFDAVVSTAAIHWMDKTRLERLYNDLAKILTKGGIFLNGDIMPGGKERLQEISERIRYSRYGTLKVEFTPWQEWWERVERQQGSLAPMFREKRERFANGQASEELLPIGLHTSILRKVGFSEADTIWQSPLQDRVLAAIL